MDVLGVQVDGTHVVHDHRQSSPFGCGESVMEAEHPLEQGRLSGTQKPGQQRHGHPLVVAVAIRHGPWSYPIRSRMPWWMVDVEAQCAFLVFRRRLFFHGFRKSLLEVLSKHNLVSFEE